MGTIAASVIIGRAERTLIDETNKTWTAAEHLDHLNTVIRRTVKYNQRDFIGDGNITLVAGTRQSSPVEGLPVLDIWRTAAGGVVQRKKRDRMDHNDQNWHALPQTAEILHWYPDEFSPGKFWVHPPAEAGAVVVGEWAAVPTILTAENQAIPIPDMRDNALWAGVVSLALAKTTKRGDLARAQYYEAIWRADIGASAEAQLLMFPLPPEETPTAKVAAQ